MIAAMNNGTGPDLLGVSEVENRLVVERLVDRVMQHWPLLEAMRWCPQIPTMPAGST